MHLLRLLLALVLLAAPLAADPCGMVPPIQVSAGTTPALTRVGAQETYVFYKDGVESIAIRPGFRGRVESFGMLIPFPAPPALRKVPDALFDHIRASTDVPEVVHHLASLEPMDGKFNHDAIGLGGGSGGGLELERVRVLRREAVGMYEVAVLEAGSAAALKRWMDDHGFRYPDGMDRPVNDYVGAGWCFVAVKTRVAEGAAADPRPGMRRARPRLPAGAGFSGHVQGMGFRFRSAQPVVPMRLSAFNPGRLRNVVYVLTDRPVRFAQLPGRTVVRQLPGAVLRRNLTSLRPLRVVGGTVQDIAARDWAQLKRKRDPASVNGLARTLYAGDLAAVASRRLTHPHETSEKVLLRIGEALRLRGPALDRLQREALADQRAPLDGALAALDSMTLTVLDADLPREVLARENLTLVSYRMPTAANRRARYDAVKLGRGAPAPGPAPRRGQLGLWLLLAGASLLGLTGRQRRAR